MAIMIPEKPVDIPPHSREDDMFSALEILPDDYYVFHSFRIITKVSDTIHESETDFVIFNFKKGIMCIEAKAGQVTCTNDTWFYANGLPMSKGGPYKQADLNKWKLTKYFEQNGLSSILAKCKLVHAVWFPSISRVQINQIIMTAAGEKALTLTKEALDDPKNFIDAIFGLSIAGQPDTTISSVEGKKILDTVLCPSFNLLPLASAELDRKKNVFAKMLKEQSNILNFLEDQNAAVISGVAGTGKTLIAVEKARRHSENEESVLFLCFNKYLCEHLRNTFPYSNVFFYTIDGFACATCNSPIADYEMLQSKIEYMYYNNSFPYKHIIIDEAQDFGQERIEEHGILKVLETVVLSDDKCGTFYLFYDKNQLIQGHRLPSCIEEADCKLTLYKNCRNTENIATTSLRPLKSSKPPKMISGCIKGDLVNIYIEDNTEILIQQLNNTIKKLLNERISDIVILTCETENNSFLSKYVNNGIYRIHSKDIKFTTCRKFKGLESDAILLIDVSKKILSNDSALLFYVGASRTRFNLTIFSQIYEQDYVEMCETFDMPVSNRFKKNFAAQLNALLQP